MLNRKERKAKNKNNVNLVDEEEGADIDDLVSTKWDINEKLNSNNHNFRFAKHYENGINFTKKTFDDEGFSSPILFINDDGLGLNLPREDFGVNDVAANVGKDRVLDVVDVNTQDAIGMTMKEWCHYFNKPTKDRLLNVISLEYSQTKMDEIVKAPDVVLDIDWLESCWPQSCRDVSVDNQSHLKSLTYPKVRKYCLMGTSGCFTDFHIDLGGTSVWYHIFKGEKVFWMIPPTKENLIIFEKWCLSVDQASYFFADLVENCEKVHLRKGNTFIIPSGWIHGVYTPVDSLVFGGNFLHSFSIETQLRIWSVEERIKVSTKYRYPFFVEMHWYALATFVGKVNGKCYLKQQDKQEPKNDVKSQGLSFYSALNDYEMIGIFIIYMWLLDLSASQNKLVPDKIISSTELLTDAKHVIQMLPLIPKTSQAYQELEPYIMKLAVFQKDSIKSAPSKKKVKMLHKSASGGSTKPSPLVTLGDSDPKTPSIDQKPSKRKRAKVVHPVNPEIPVDMFVKITERIGSRQIRRPDRLIEASKK